VLTIRGAQVVGDHNKVGTPTPAAQRVPFAVKLFALMVMFAANGEVEFFSFAMPSFCKSGAKTGTPGVETMLKLSRTRFPPKSSTTASRRLCTESTGVS